MGVWGWGTGIIPHYGSEEAVQHRLCPFASSLLHLQGSQSLGWAKCGHNPEEKLRVVRGHMHLRSCIQSATGYHIHIL